MKFDKALNEVYAVENFAIGATDTAAVRGIPTRLPKDKKKGKKGDKIVRRPIGNFTQKMGTLTL